MPILNPPPRLKGQMGSGVQVVRPIEVAPIKHKADGFSKTSQPTSPPSATGVSEAARHTSNELQADTKPSNAAEPSSETQPVHQKNQAIDVDKIDLSKPPKIWTIPGNKKFLDFYSKLIKAYPKDYAMIHGCGGKDHSPNSTIGLKLYDYSAGKGESSVTVTYALDAEEIPFFYKASQDARLGQLQPKAGGNAAALSSLQQKLLVLAERTPMPDGNTAITPREIAELQCEIAKCMGNSHATEYEGFPYIREKNDCRKRSANGYVPVTKLVVNYSPIYNGKANPYPWYVYIENFLAPAIDQPSGTVFHDSSKAIKRSFASINVSLADFMAAMVRVDAYIRQWEGRSFNLINAACTQAENAQQKWREENRKKE